MTHYTATLRFRHPNMQHRLGEGMVLSLDPGVAGIASAPLSLTATHTSDTSTKHIRTDGSPQRSIYTLSPKHTTRRSGVCWELLELSLLHVSFPFQLTTTGLRGYCSPRLLIAGYIGDDVYDPIRDPVVPASRVEVMTFLGVRISPLGL